MLLLIYLIYSNRCIKCEHRMQNPVEFLVKTNIHKYTCFDDGSMYLCIGNCYIFISIEYSGVDTIINREELKSRQVCNFF